LSAADDAGGSGVKEIRYTTDGSNPTATSGSVYSGSFAVSSTTTVRYRAFDNVGNAEDVNSQLVRIDKASPTVAITAPSDGATVSGNVNVAASASDADSGVDRVEFLVDGDVVGSDASAPYTYGWDSSAMADGTHAIRARAVDLAGNSTTSDAASVTVNNAPSAPDVTAPTSTIRCNGGACASGWYADSVDVALSAADDAGGSGVKEIRYTTDGSDPTATSESVFSNPVNVSLTTTVKYRAFDNAGNAEAVNSQLIRVDMTPPTVAITAPANNATITGTVKVTANASDGVSGVARVTFYLDGNVLGNAPAAPYSTQWNTKKTTKGTHTLTAVADDTAGNSTKSAAVTVTVR